MHRSSLAVDKNLRSEEERKKHGCELEPRRGSRADEGEGAKQAAESYADNATSIFINENFVAVQAHIKEQPAYFHRFGALWTPTVLILDGNGVERQRSEGYLPNTEFRARLEMGLARNAFMSKQWPQAEQEYAGVAEKYPHTSAAPEAVYWKGVSQYKATNEHAVE
jgi:TolA-binding protein